MENASLKPYPDYKPSGIEWLGDVPAHWDLLPLSAITRPKTDTYKEGLELLSVYLDRGVIKFKDAEERRTNPTSEDVSNYKVVDPGDFVLNNQQAWRGSVGVSKYKGVVSPAYFVLSLSSRLDLEFANLLFRDRSMVSQYLVSSRGVGTIQRNLYWPQLKKITTTVPSLAEQTAIVRYLGRADDRIHRAISAKERLIELLTEQRQAVIHRAVTRGLDPNAPLKDSGVEWLGDVPEHWESTAAKRHYEVQLGKMLQPSPNSPNDVEVPYLKAQHVHWNHIRIENAPTMWASHKEVEQFSIRQGDLLIVEGGAGATNSGILEKIPDGYIIQNALHRVRPKRQARNDFLLYMMMTVAASGWFEAINNKATIPHFTKEKLDGLPIPCPPLEEQAAIVRHLDKATSDIDTAIDKAQRQIDLLREYRTRLIADVVTGQVGCSRGCRGRSRTTSVVTARSRAVVLDVG